KTSNDWYDLMPVLREFIKGFLESGEKIEVRSWKLENPISGFQSPPSLNAVEEKIIQTLEEYVKPAVEQDGGAIHFKSFHDGVVTLILKGSCSGCPSSLLTLK